MGFSQTPAPVTGTGPNQTPENYMLGSAAFQDMRFIDYSFTWDVGNLTTESGETSAAQTVLGAALGDFVRVGCSVDTQGMIITGWVSAADTVYVRVNNETGGTINLASATWYIRVFKRIP